MKLFGDPKLKQPGKGLTSRSPTSARRSGISKREKGETT